MRKLLAGVALLLVACGASPEYGAGARPYVRPLMKEDGDIFCSAVVIRPGVVMTASHCADLDMRLAQYGTVGTVVAAGNEQFDLALVLFTEAEAPCPCARIADSEAALDEPVVVVGYPRGLTQVVTRGAGQGVINNSALPYGGPRLVSTAPVYGGNSGGGVFVQRNNEYQLVGILVEGFAHISLSMPVVSINQFLQPAL